jgi:hypothetical protein
LPVKIPTPEPAGWFFHPAIGEGKGRFTDTLTHPDEWFVLEVIAQGNHLTTKVNGKVAVDLIDPDRNFLKGHVGLQLLKKTVVQFRKTEIQELTRNNRESLPAN